MSTRRGILRGAAGAAAVAGIGSVAGAARSPAREHAASHGVRTGFDVLRAHGYAELSGQRTGLISNPTGITGGLTHIADVLHDAPGVDLVAVFGPEHGFRGSAQAGGSEGDAKDPRTGLAVYDTYGASADDIAGFFRKARLDTVVFDIQDAGARFYTYIWTMYDCMRAAAKARVRFVVLDRPNPLGGTAATGPVLHKGYASGVGKAAIAQQHGMTVGELAALFDAEFLGRTVKPHVIGMEGWRRGMRYEETGLPWVPPSPNMPTVDTAVVYPGLGLFEAVNLSEGRGTTRPFEIVGAPYADWHWVDALNDLGLPGVAFREAYFAPTSDKWKGRNCTGVQVTVTDRARFDAVRTGVALIVTARRMYRGDFAWRESKAPYWIDTLTGSDQVRKAVDAGHDTGRVVAGWQADLRAFQAKRARHLRYR